MKYKLIAVLAAACLLLGCLSGCAGTGVQNYSGPQETASPTPTGAADAQTPAHDFAAARAKYPLDTVVMTVNGSDVTWSEFFYWLYYSIGSAEQYLGTVSDFSATSSFDDTQTYAQYFTNNARDMVVQYHALEMNAKAAGAVISDADEQSMADILQSDIVSCIGQDGTEEQFYDYLANLYVTPELYNYINSVSILYKNCFDKLYGATGENLSDEDVDAFREANGYMTAKHILISTKDSEGADLSDEEKAEKLTLAQDIAAQLAAETDQDARLALFDQLMAEYNDDTGEDYYPGGYCFTSGDMVEEFETAAAALADYEVSGVVESDYGYHIILRLPTTPDDLVVSSGSSGEPSTLRYTAAMDAYNVLVGNWLSDADIVWAPDFQNFDMSTLFA